MNHPFIVLEGLSGSGKTTIARKLAEKIGGVFYSTPCSVFRQARDLVDKEVNAQSRFLFYLASLMQSSEEVKRIIFKQPVVCDRYILSTMCWHKVMGVDVHLLNPFIEQNLLNPTHQFLITCESVIRKRRLIKRGLTINDKNELKDKNEDKFFREYQKYHIKEVDNSQDDPDLAVKKIIALL